MKFLAIYTDYDTYFIEFDASNQTKAFEITLKYIVEEHGDPNNGLKPGRIPDGIEKVFIYKFNDKYTLDLEQHKEKWREDMLERQAQERERYEYTEYQRLKAKYEQNRD